MTRTLTGASSQNPGRFPNWYAAFRTLEEHRGIPRPLTAFLSSYPHNNIKQTFQASFTDCSSRVDLHCVDCNQLHLWKEREAGSGSRTRYALIYGHIRIQHTFSLLDHPTAGSVHRSYYKHIRHSERYVERFIGDDKQHRDSHPISVNNTSEPHCPMVAFQDCPSW